MNVCFIGHRKLDTSDVLRNDLYRLLNDLIKNGANRFIFGSKSEFTHYCWEIVTELKAQKPTLERINVRTDYLEYSEDYLIYLNHFYEKIISTEKIINAGRLRYVARDRYMIDISDVAVFYYDDKCSYKSGTRAAYEYALSKKIKIINIF